MSEFITVPVGQCGNQIGGSFWPLLIKEYEDLHKRNIPPYSFSSFFYHSMDNEPKITDFKNGNLRARTVMIDMEDSVISSLRNGHCRNLYDPQSTFTSYPGSGNNWSIGFFEHGGTHGEKLEEILQKAVEKCDRLTGFLPLFSLAGGTGSGVGSFVLTLLEEMYPKLCKLVTCVHPGVNSDVITMPYNVAFSLDTLLKNASCVFPVDNKALLDLCHHHSKHLDRTYLKPYANMNNVISKFLLHLTSVSRFPGVLNLDMGDIVTGMIPFPQMNFLSSSYSPIVMGNSCNTPRRSDTVRSEIISRHNTLMRIDARQGSVMSNTLVGRGNITLTTLQDYADWVHKSLKYVPWNEGTKLSLCSAPPATFPHAVLNLVNTTAMSELFAETCRNFQKLYSRKAHVHHYEQVYGFPEDKFSSTYESLQSVICDYKTISSLSSL